MNTPRIQRWTPEPGKRLLVVSDIHGNVQHAALHHAHQLALRVRRPLEMQAPQHAAAAPTQIVLHKTYLH